MRPISLTVGGLHSFRERQTVDFTSLCEGGVFGIFGPTGSGKSSLLDAMTLALYGKVERAPNNTQGILNHAEDALYVSFTFALGDTEYQVERSLKRTKEVSLKTATSRLIDVTGEKNVLADKAGDVNRAVQELLGLSIEDFTRAVVLPQGKFAEFLSLKGSDRRQMLQRLFRLERYGDELIQRVKRRLRDTDSRKKEIEAEMNGLGDASKEAVEEAEKRVVELDEAREKAQQTLANYEKDYDTKKNLFDKQQELLQVESHLRQMAEKEKEVERWQWVLEKAKKARHLQPYAEAYKNAKQDVEKKTAELQQASKQYEDTKKKEEEARLAFEKTDKIAQEEKPQLEQEQSKLQEAKKAKEREQVVRDEINQLDKQLDDHEKQRQTIAENQNLAEQKKKKYTDKQQELKTELQTLEAQREQGKQVYEAYDEKQKIVRVEERVNERKNECEKSSEALKAIEEKENTKNVNVEQGQQQLQKRLQAVHTWYERVCEEERQLEEMQTYLQDRIEAAREAREQSTRLELARQLAAHLETGDPCPVCGSTEHPNPVSEHTEDSDQSVENHLDERKVQQWQDRIQKGKMNIQQQQWKLQQLSNQLTEVCNDEGSTVQYAATVEEESESIEPSLPKTEEKDHSEEAWQRWFVKVDKEADAIEDLHRIVQNELKAIQEEKQALYQIQIERQSSAKTIDEQQQRYDEEMNNLRLLKQSWQEQFPSFKLEAIDEQRQEVKAREEAVHKLRERIENSTPYIDEQDKVLRDLQEQESQLRVDIATKSSDRKAKVARADELKQEWEALAKGADVDQRLIEIEKRLTFIDEQYIETKRVYDELFNTWQGVQQQFALAKQANHEADKRFQEAEKQWEAYREDSPFATTEDLTESLLTGTEHEQYEKAIAEYAEEKNSYMKKQQELKDVVAEQNVSEEEIAQIKYVIGEQKQAVEQLQEERGRAKEIANDRKEKHDRYNELEQSREALVKAYDQYQKLDQVFRGKAFVEFVAEEQLIFVARQASERLHALTRGRYAIEVDSNSGFIIRDDANGGVRRPVSTLSGGETFLTSLALALALSQSIQLQGQYPLEFFFLDEGFGTLDQELLDTVVTALEKLQTNHLSVGVISHVPELKARLPKKCIVTPPTPGGNGSRITIESM
ncbi:SbcC/MukB-like Walker B domain-containing protein [Texcoconibacillus texcoconensis]|uniref:Nuclease SbcCD subunit C n=1 Tax=Texcoconibacillus texcoconensis TaxID=1095777 RepID=A0A840QTK8_9BACI|nr:SMC family ATPase [Texcoconibacillus texcoconensis]MBB5174704.1 exonuclease SbcC [Texcoconibacillus texcoconensis]